MGWRSGQSYSQDLRDRVLGAVDGGISAREAAAIYKALIRRRLTGDVGINPGRSRLPRKLSSEQEYALGIHLRSHPGMTLAQARAWLQAEHGIALSTGAVECSPATWIVVQKKPCARPSRTARRRRPAQAVEGHAAVHRSRYLVFLDEAGVNTKMAHLYGWAPVGERCRDSAPFSHWKTMTFIAGLRLTGMTAPWVLDGAMDGEAFRTYVEHVLAPTLKPGDVVVLDNLPAHKGVGIRETIARRRAQNFYPPPYSPDMNPIEMASSKLKALLRQEPARTVSGLVERIGRLLHRFQPDECANFFQAAGYQCSS